MSETTARAENSESSIVKSASELESITRKILVAAGASEENAIRVAQGLVSSNLCGVDTHGLWQLSQYVGRMKKGYLDPTASPRIVSQTSSSALVSGRWTFGHVAAKYATQIAIEKARGNQISVVSIVQCEHIGRLGEYVEMAAAEGLISMIWAGGFAEQVPEAVPFGGRKAVLQTNPVAMAFPLQGTSPMMFDFATTVLSGSKVRQLQEAGKPVPPDSIVDRDGNPTTNAADYFAGGAALAFGRHKGYAIMLAAEYLGRILTGSDDFAQEGRGGPVFGHSGTTIIAIKADLFQALPDYSQRAQEMADRIRAVPPAPGFQEVLVPGDLEARTRAIRQRDGIPVPRKLWDEIMNLGRSLGITDF